MNKNILRAVTCLLTLVLTACGGSSSSDKPFSFGNLCIPVRDSVTFTLNSQRTIAQMKGVIDCTAVGKVSALLKHDTLTTIHMLEVPGSADDDVNLKAATMVRNAGINIVLVGDINNDGKVDGKIASGGVDFFIAGVTRTIEKGGLVAVHSWADSDGTQGIELYSRNPDAKDHQSYIRFYQNMGMTEQEARDFYVFTLRAAPAEQTHCMSAEELRRYKVVTNPQLNSQKTLRANHNRRQKILHKLYRSGRA
ncbi:hypothetical protein ACU6U9_20385 [Pseudomonas sp. HK3]